MKLLVFGCGYSGRAIAKEAMDTFDSVQGTTRSSEKARDLQDAGIAPILYDGGMPSSELKAIMRETTHLVQSIAPGSEGDPLTNLGHEQLKAMLPALQWVGYLSTVGVYGHHDGQWVNEGSECRPVSKRSRERVEAEKSWLSFAGATGIPLAILRLSGIYGPGRNTFCNLEKGTARRLIKKDQVFNRIRVEDIGRAAAFLLAGNHSGIFNVTDDEPAAPQDLVEFAALMKGVAVPPEQPFETADLSPMARSFYGENKRVSNAKIKQLGFEFSYPDYRKSLTSLWESATWQ